MRTTRTAQGRVESSPTAVEKLCDARRHQFSLAREFRNNWQGWLGSGVLHGGLLVLCAALTVSVVAVPPPTNGGYIPVDPFEATPTFDKTPPDPFEQDPFAQPVGVEAPEGDKASVENEHPSDVPGYNPDLEPGVPDWITSGGHLIGRTGDAGGDGDRLVGKRFGKVLRGWQDIGLDVVFCFDSTGSMGGVISECRSRIRSLAKVVSYLVPNARIGVVTYRDWKKYDLDDYEYLVKYIPLQKCDKDGFEKIQRFLRETEAYGGGDIPEAVQAGLDASMDPKMGWRPHAHKIVIVFGDAPPHPEDNGLAYTYGLCKAFQDHGGVVSTIDTTGGSKIMDEFREMAREGGGEAIFLNDERAIVRQLAVMIFGKQWEKEVDRVYTELNKDADAVVRP